LLNSTFDEQLEDYPEVYDVFAMPRLSQADLDGPWYRLPERATRRIGQIPVERVVFDPSKRKQIDVSIIDELLTADSRASG
jgi:hypothetical protein